MPAGERAEGVADPAEDHGGEDGSSSAKPRFGVSTPIAPASTPARPASPPARTQVSRITRAVSMPGGLGEVEVVGERAHLLAERRVAQHQPDRDERRRPDDDDDQLGAADAQARGT